jgi:hypothetical protein
MRRGYEFMGRRIDPYGFFLRSLRRLVDKYEGEYVAMVDARVVAHGRNGKEVCDRARRAYPGSRILLAEVPSAHLDPDAIPMSGDVLRRTLIVYDLSAHDADRSTHTIAALHSTS